MELLFSWLLESDVGDRWRYHGTRPNFEQFVAELWAGVLEQDMVVSRSTGDPAGVASAYNADMRSGTCYAALMSAPSYVDTGLGLEGFGLFVSNLFRNWQFRKVHFEVFGYNQMLVKNLSRQATLEARLTDDLQWNGAWYDRYIFTVDRETWVSRFWPVVARLQ